MSSYYPLITFSFTRSNSGIKLTSLPEFIEEWLLAGWIPIAYHEHLLEDEWY